MGSACTKSHEGEGQFYDIPNDPEASTIFAGKTSEIREDKFTVVKVDSDHSVLVAKYNKKYYAVGDKCPHAGNSLVDAPIRLGRARCLAHGSCFDIESGDIEDYPGFDCIATYKTSVKGRSVYVQVNPKKMPNRLIRPMAKCADESLRVVIIGSGAAGYTCAQTLRMEGFIGRIIIVTEEKYLPYDRTLLSKEPNCNFQKAKIRGASFYHENDIEVLLNKTVTKIDMKNHLLFLEGNSKADLYYDNLFIATGLKPRFYSPSVPGSDLGNITVLRTLEHHKLICEKAQGKDVVIVGSSFTGMELAEMLSPIARSVHILSRSKMPYGIVFGEKTSMTILDHILKKLPNVIFHPTDEVRQFVGGKTGVTAVYTVKKQTIGCGLVVVGIGGLPNTEFLEGSGVALNKVDHSILVNKFLETSLPQIFAGGDAASFPFSFCSRDRAMVSHWQMASMHGKVAALNILGRDVNIEDVVPYFTTEPCGLNVRYIGYGEGYDEALIYGKVEDLKFCTVYRRRRRLNAVCCVGCPKLASELILLFETEKEFVIEIPPPILKTFPKEPTNAEAYHAVKQEYETHQHDMNMFRLEPLPMEPFEIETMNRHLRAQRVPLGFDLMMRLTEDDEEKAYALEIYNMRRDQQDRRRLEKTRWGSIKGNIEEPKPQ